MPVDPVTDDPLVDALNEFSVDPGSMIEEVKPPLYR
jgi:hypothetical protein